MDTGSITVVEGESTLQTLLSLQFVYRGSTVCREYGCFISCTKTLEEIEYMMSRYEMPSERMRDSPSIVMLDAGKLKEISLQANGNSFQLKMLSKLLEEIHKDIKFTRLAFDRFDFLCENNTDIKKFFRVIRTHRINTLLTIGTNYNHSALLELCDNYFLIKRGELPLILFS